MRERDLYAFCVVDEEGNEEGFVEITNNDNDESRPAVTYDKDAAMQLLDMIKQMADHNQKNIRFIKYTGKEILTEVEYEEKH